MNRLELVKEEWLIKPLENSSIEKLLLPWEDGETFAASDKIKKKEQH